MKSRFQQECTILLIAFILTCSGCRSTTPIPATPGISTIPFQRVEIGLCEDYPKETRSIEVARGDLLLLKTNNIRVMRISFAWDSIEAEPGRYDWSFWDDFVRMAAAYDIRLIPYVCYTPRWNSTGNESNYWRFPPRDNERFANFMKVIVNRYKGNIHSWELWNEPDNRDYWEGTAGQYAELLKAGSKAVRKADPTAKVVAGGIAWNLDFLRELLEEHQISPAVDVINLHNYYETWSPDPLEQIGDYVRRAGRIIDLHGNHQPIWLAEIGYSNYRRDSHVSDAYSARFDYEHTPAFQADSLGRALSSALATGRVQLIAWYRVHDLLPSTTIIGDVNNRHLGVLDLHGNSKPVLQALTFMHSLFKDEFRCLDRTIPATRLIQSDTELHVFEKRSREKFITTWLRTVTWDEVQRPGKDMRQETVDVILPTPARKARVYDESGIRLSTVETHKENDRAVLESIPLEGGEFKVYLFPPPR